MGCSGPLQTYLQKEYLIRFLCPCDKANWLTLGPGLNQNSAFEWIFLTVLLFIFAADIGITNFPRKILQRLEWTQLDSVKMRLRAVCDNRCAIQKRTRGNVGVKSAGNGEQASNLASRLSAAAAAAGWGELKMNSTFKISLRENNFPQLECLKESSDAQTMANSAFALDTDEIATELRLAVNYLTNFACQFREDRFCVIAVFLQLGNSITIFTLIYTVRLGKKTALNVTL